MFSSSKRGRRSAIVVAFVLGISLVPAVALARGHYDSRRDPRHHTLRAAFSWGHGKAVDTVYVMSNQASNSVASFLRRKDGSLTPGGTFSTGGMGTGTGLASQSALALSPDRKWLFAVDAGSNQVSSFEVRPHGQLRLVDLASSDGTMPVSVSASGRLLYVLNDGASGNIAGFWLDRHGHIHALAGSVEPLSNLGVGTAPVAEQIGIKTRDGAVVVTEKSTNMIDLYPLVNGVAGMPTAVPSVGAAPYGFDFTCNGALVVSEAAVNSLSSYSVSTTSLSVISASVPDSGTAPCWVSISRWHVYVSDAHSNGLSIYRVGANGTLTLQQSPAATVNTPLDLDTTFDGRFLYVLAAGSQTVDGFKVNGDGSLTPLGSLATIPASSTGLVAR
jgi:6-phosphogluconolactonase